MQTRSVFAEFAEQWMDQLAEAWWGEERSHPEPYVQGRGAANDVDSRIDDMARAVFDSVFAIDLAIEGFARRAADATELAAIGTGFLEDASRELGMDVVLGVLTECDLPAETITMIRSGINPALMA